jgi:hypothetical protein
VKRGVFTGGGNVSIGGFQFGGINYYSQDVINIGYGETKYVLPVTERLGLLFAGQYSDQRSTGKHLLTGASFMTNQVGVKTDMSYGGAILTLAYTNTAEGANMQNPWSSYPGYTSVQVKNFNRAGEEAFMIKGSYDFSRLGLEGVTAYALLVHGWGAVNPATTSAVINQNEYDFDAQWRPKIDFLKGVWFRGRYGRVEQQGSNGSSINEFRFMVNYDFPLL